MRRISTRSAKALCGLYPAPRPGHETIVAVADNGYGGKYRLCVQNISGAWFLASTCVCVDRWPEIFQVKIIEPSRDTADEERAELE